MKHVNLLALSVLILSLMIVSCKKDDTTNDDSNNNNNPTTFTCGSDLVDSRDNKTYGTILLGGKCWMKKNLDIGTKVNTTADQANNSTIEKYCSGNSDANCTTYGGLYQWDEAMQYSATEGTAGICPAGWHIPTDAEWTVLVGLYSSAAGTALKSGGTSGFNALLGGRRDPDGGSWQITEGGYFWSSTLNGSNPWYRFVMDMSTDVTRQSISKSYGFSVRCVKNA